MRAFLHKLLSSKGHPVAWVLKGDVKYNVMFSSIDEMANSLPNLDNNNDAVYFAVATYKDFRKKNARKTDNVLYYKTLWMDIDVDPQDPNKYSNQKEVLQALGEFLTKSHLPRPMIVSSGGGIHLYWPLIDEITIEQWQTMPDMLIAMAHHIGFKLDVACVKLPTQVLRPVGTHHKKDPTNPKEVRLLKDAAAHRFPDLKTIVEHYITNHEINVVETNKKKHTNAFELLVNSAGWTYEPVMPLRNAQPIIDQCKQVRDGATAGEPIWRGMLSIIRLCEDGRDIAHWISSKDPRYNAHDTDAKLDNLDETQGVSGMPMTCAQFAQLNPSGCELCTARVTSPIVLGIPDDNKKEIEVEQQQFETPEIIQTHITGRYPIVHPRMEPAPPLQTIVTSGGRFNLTDQGVVVTTYEKDEETGDMKQHNVVLCAQKLYPIDYIYKVNDEGNKEYYYMWRIEDGRGSFNDCIVAADVFHSQGLLVTEFTKFGVIIEKQQHFPLFGTFMRSWIKTLTDQTQASKMYETLGWQSNGDFVCGKSVVTEQGGVHRAILNEEAQGIANLGNMEPTGDYAKWQAAINVFNKVGQEHAQMAICSSFAGPLMSCTNIRGFLLSLQGKSGAGKSTIQEAAASVWGKPKPQLRSAPGTKRGDTDLSVIRAIGVYKNIPTQMEEITNMPNETISDFVYSLSLGAEKSRLKQNKQGGYSRNAGLNWQTVFVSSSNLTIRDKLSAAKTDFEAESMRIFEISNIPTLTETDMISDTQLLMDIEDNYGHAGVLYIKYLQENKSQLKVWVDDKIRTLSEKMKATQSERFWVQGLAAWFVGAEIAKIAGIHDFDLERLEKYVEEHYLHQRKILSVTKDYASTSFSEMINSLLPDAIVTTTNNSLKGGLCDTHLVPKTGKLYMRIELDKRCGYLSSNRVRTWANQNETTVTAVINSGLEAGYLDDDNTLEHSLGDGVTGYSGTGKVRVYKFNLQDSEKNLLENQIIETEKA